MKKLLISASLIMFWICPVIADENIYSWKDKEGISHFSNQKPPDNIEKYSTSKATSQNSTLNDPAEENLPEYDGMIEDARNQIQQNEDETREKEIQRAEEEKQKAEADRKAQIEAKRKELQDKIDDLKKRQLSRTFNTAAKNTRINIIQKQIDELDKSQ